MDIDKEFVSESEQVTSRYIVESSAEDDGGNFSREKSVVEWVQHDSHVDPYIHVHHEPYGRHHHVIIRFAPYQVGRDIERHWKERNKTVRLKWTVIARHEGEGGDTPHAEVRYRGHILL